MELSIFNNEDAIDWLVEIEWYYEIMGDERIELVLVAMEGQALNWYHA